MIFSVISSLSSLSLQWPSHLLYLRGFLVIAGGFFVELAVGSSYYTFGNMAPYIVSYIQEYSHPTDLKQETIAWILASTFIGEGLAGFLGGWMSDIIGPRWTTLIGGIVITSSVGVSYFSIKISFWLLLVTYGFVYGVGVGIIYVAPLTAAMKWMPNHKGLASGVIMTGYGLSVFVFGVVQTIYINPNNVQTVSDGRENKFSDPDLLGRVPFSFVVLAIIYGTVIFTGSLLITDPPVGYNGDQEMESMMAFEVTEYYEVDDNSEVIRTNSLWMSINSKVKAMLKYITMKFSSHNEGSDEESESSSSLSSSDDDETGLSNSDACANNHSMKPTASSWNSDDVISLTPKEMLHRPYFYVLSGIFLLSLTVIISVSSNYKFFGERFINDDHFLTSVASIACIFNISGRIFWGMIADQLSYKLSLVLIFSILTVFLLTMYACTLGGKIMFLIWVCVIFFCIGGRSSVFPVAIGQAYGLQHVSTNYGILTLFRILAGPLSALLSTVLSMQYTLIFLGTSILSGSAFVLSMFYKPKLYVAFQSEK